MIMKCKKGVSPLVATILLIAFAVALGAVVMSYGSAYYSDREVSAAAVSSPNDACDAISLSVYRIADKEQICYGGTGAAGFVNFMLDNQGNGDIDELQVSIIGEKGTQENRIAQLIGKGQLYDKRDKTAKYNFDANGVIYQVQVRPYIKVQGQMQVCINKQITVANIQGC
jgi:flagellin-like protein